MWASKSAWNARRARSRSDFIRAIAFLFAHRCTLLTCWLMVAAMLLPAATIGRTIPYQTRWASGFCCGHSGNCGIVPSVMFDDPVAACTCAMPVTASCGVQLYTNPRWLTDPNASALSCAYRYIDTYSCPITNVIDPLFDAWAGPVKICPDNLPLIHDYDANPINYRCQAPDDKTPPRSCPATPNPVSVATGGKFLEEADFSKPFAFSRYFTSRKVQFAFMGPQWRHTFSSSVVYYWGTPNPTVIAFRADG